MSCLQLVPGVFAIFYHSALGRYSKSKASILSLFFILGTEITSAVLFISAFYISYVLFINDLNPRNNVLTWIFISILLILAFLSYFFYFRKPHSKDTEIFIPRDYARKLIKKASSISNPSDAFALGAFVNVYELVFTFPLYIITATEIMYMHTEYFADDLMTLIYILASVIPLFQIYYSFRFGRNLADIQKSRVKNKSFHRFIISFSYLTIAILTFCFRIV